MIDSGRRVVFLAENHAGAAPWYRPAYRALTEETPYTFGKAALLNDPARVPASCRPNRGPKRAPLFLINHWITTDPSRGRRTPRRSTPTPAAAAPRECRGCATTSRTSSP